MPGVTGLDGYAIGDGHVVPGLACWVLSLVFLSVEELG